MIRISSKKLLKSIRKVLKYTRLTPLATVIWLYAISSRKCIKMLLALLLEPRSCFLLTITASHGETKISWRKISRNLIRKDKSGGKQDRLGRSKKRN